jgi:hypothetical protein
MGSSGRPEVGEFAVYSRRQPDGWFPTSTGLNTARKKLLRNSRKTMKTYEIEDWALRAIERVESQQPNEDTRVELKADWIDPQKAARRIAGHANEMRGEPILWLIGVDEQKGVKGADQNNLADWWPQVMSGFDGPVPRLREKLVHWKGKTVVALHFESDEIPYVVKNPVRGQPNAGPVELEVPWREATRVRSANHSDLILLLSPLQKPVLKVEVGKGRGFLNHYSSILPNIGPIESYYLRVKVVNTGRRTAEKCRGYLANVEQCHNGSCLETVYADFMPLVWSHNPGRESMDLLPQVPHWLDVLSTRKEGNSFVLETNPQSTKYSNCVWGLGTYRLTIKLFAEETEPRQAFVFLNWGGVWDLLDVFDETAWEERKSRGH